MIDPRQTFKDLSYSFPADLIATWCEVDIQTVRHWKAGTREPGAAAFKLFALHVEGRVLPADWEGFSFRDGKMWDPYGKPFTRAQLRLYGIAWQIFREWTRDDAERRATLDDLMGGKYKLLLAEERRSELASVALSAEAKPSLPHHPSPETVRRRNRQRPVER